MKEASISLSCFAVIQQKLSTCLQWYYPTQHSIGKEMQQKWPKSTIQVLAAFSPDGFFNNQVISIIKNNVV